MGEVGALIHETAFQRHMYLVEEGSRYRHLLQELPAAILDHQPLVAGRDLISGAHAWIMFDVGAEGDWGAGFRNPRKGLRGHYGKGGMLRADSWSDPGAVWAGKWGRGTRITWRETVQWRCNVQPVSVPRYKPRLSPLFRGQVLICGTETIAVVPESPGTERATGPVRGDFASRVHIGKRVSRVKRTHSGASRRSPLARRATHVGPNPTRGGTGRTDRFAGHQPTLCSAAPIEDGLPIQASDVPPVGNRAGLWAGRQGSRLRE